jgi:diguanylate cyclase (GGDEF)-like protein
MTFLISTELDPASGDGAEQVRRQLVLARHAHYEHPEDTLVEAIRCQDAARSLNDDGLSARAYALQAAVSLHRGDLRGALALAVEAERHAQACGDTYARAEVAALKAQLSFFTGSYAEALRQAELSVQLADEAGDIDLRIFTRRTTCPVFGNARVSDLRERVEELLELTIQAGDRWEEALSRNDLAYSFQEAGDLATAELEVERAMAVADAITSANSFLLGVIHSTRADIRLLRGRPEQALADAERAIELLVATGDPNPYVLGVTVRALVEARMKLGALEDAQEFGEGALRWLGDRVPQTRSLILTTIATTLREAGRVEEAYDALARAAELERQAFHELSEIQLKLERATLESERLRDQAERDWLTGLHNRRYLARELERLANQQLGGPFSLAVVDLDHFKAINDRFGHAAGDHVLVRVAALLCDALRTSDIVVRSGGEEFLVLMPQTEVRAARACCERIRATIRDEAWREIADGLALSTSIGLASTDDTDDLESLVRIADGRLYEAKRSGRDCVVSGPQRTTR